MYFSFIMLISKRQFDTYFVCSFWKFLEKHICMWKEGGFLRRHQLVQKKIIDFHENLNYGNKQLI